jgi:hypothetical protein
MEGTAELLATHLWEQGQLKLRYFPSSREKVPEWGRIKIIKDDVRAGRSKTLQEVMNYDSRAHLRVEPYGWSWAAAAFLDAHPGYQQRFRALQKESRVTDASFSQRFVQAIGNDSQRLGREWEWFITNIDYGYDIAREAFQYKMAETVPEDGRAVEIAADRGWQSSGIQIEAGKKYRIAATGRYQLGTQPKIWWSEPNGVTIRYHRGQPLGMLLGAIVDESNPQIMDNKALSGVPISSGLETTPARSGVLYLRINDAPSELSDNRGSATVKITIIK